MKRRWILFSVAVGLVVLSGRIFGYYCEYLDTASGVRVICGIKADMFPLSWRKGRIDGRAVAADRRTASRLLTILKGELKKYPAPFLRRRLQRVYILKKLSFFGLSYGGSYYLPTGTVYLTSSSPNYFKQLFHAEFSSIIYRGNKFSFPFASWKGANAPSFTYGQGGSNALRNRRSSVRFSATLHRKGFLYQYATASVEEDFNSYARNIFAATPGFWKIVFRYPGVARKVLLITRFYGQLHSRFTLRYFQSLSTETTRYPSFSSLLRQDRR